MARRRRSRFRMGWRERLTLIPHFLWINFAKTGISLSIHFGFATWNTRRGWYIDGPFGLYWRERRDRRVGTMRGSRSEKRPGSRSGN